MIRTLARTRVLFIIALFPPILYALYTAHIWEDFFIMFRHSKNLVDGNGLTFNPGKELVHGFTSPLGTLLLAFFYWITGKTSYLTALWAFRAVSAIAFAGCALNLYRLAKQKAGWELAAVLFYIFFILDIKAVAFSSNGMETAFTLFFLSWSLLNLTDDPSKKILKGGLSFAGLMWTRPDGCIYIATLALTSLMFQTNRKERFIAMAKMGAVCAVIYLPWFLWANWYFGSPIPQPVRAKQASFDLSLFTSGRIFPLLLLRAETVFYPIYALFGGWPWWLQKFVRPQVFFCLLYWAFPSSDRVGRQLSLCFLLHCIYLSGIYPFPWYLPGPAVYAWGTLALGLTTLFNYFKNKIGPYSSLPFVALGLLVFFNIFYIGIQTSYSMKIQEAEIEMGNRRQIGLWLKENMKESENLYAECIGHISYFAEHYALDYPGLATPKVAALRRERERSMMELVEPLQPDWVILRGLPEHSSTYPPYFLSHYRVAKVFDATNQLKPYIPFPGQGYAELDAKFTIYHKASN